MLRRDLAIARESEGKPTGSTAPVTTGKALEPEEASAKTEPSRPKSPAPAEVPEPPAPKKEPSAPPKASADLKVEAPKSPKKRPSPNPEDEPPAKRQAVGDEKPTKADVKPAEEPAANAPEPPLQIDTQPPPAGDSGQVDSGEERPPDTGIFSNAGDLDSLFNDAGSAGGAGAGDSGGEQNLSTGPDTGLDFDFATFNAGLEASNNENDNDNDNISALLPGLQDYANNSAGGEPDFSAPFANDPLTSGDNGQNGGGDGPEQQRDTTFDDLMGDLTFTMDGDGNDGGNDIFDFS